MVAGDGSGSLKWETVSSVELCRTSVFTVYERLSSGPDGRMGKFAVMDARDWAVVIPYLRNSSGESFLMVRQYRHGSDTSSLEFPGGVTEDGEDPAHAAARELAEETGWISDRIVHAGTVFPNPAIQSNRYHVYLALDPRPAVERKLDEHEVVDALLLPAREVRDALGEGEMSHALMCTALFLAEKCMRKLGIRADFTLPQ